MRIIAGSLKGRRLKVPSGLAVRPTADRVKEAVFSILGPAVAGARAGDLFAGSGALGLEALSRGAASCLFVEKSPKLAQMLRQSLAELGQAEKGRVLAADAASPGRLAGLGPLDLILADPPYEKGLLAPALISGAGILAPAGIMVIEHSPKEAPPDGGPLRLYDQRSYGKNRVSFFRLET